MKKEEFILQNWHLGLKCALNHKGIFNLDEEYSEPHNEICEIAHVINCGDHFEYEISDGNISYGFIEIDEFDIIARPLSDITKPITHNGETFVPIEVIGKMIEPNGTFGDGCFGCGQATGGDDFQDYYLEITKDLKFAFWCGHKDEGGYITVEENVNFSIVQKLIEWHFAIWLEDSDYIDINTLPDNIYK